MVVTDGICIEDCGTQISRPFISVCREVDLIAYFIKLRYNDLQFLECDNRCIYYRQDSSSRTDFYFAYFSENDIYYELMLSVPIGTLSSDDAMGMLFRIASP